MSTKGGMCKCIVLLWKAYISGKKANTENHLLLKVLDKWENSL